MNNNIIQNTRWNSETRLFEYTEQEISIYKVVRSITAENFAKVFEDYLNLGGKQFQEGR